MKIAKMGNVIEVTEYTRKDIENFMRYDIPFCEDFENCRVIIISENEMIIKIMEILLEMLIE